MADDTGIVGAVAPTDVYSAFALPDGTVGLHRERTAGKVVVVDITEALAAQRGVNATGTRLFSLPSCLLSGAAPPTAEEVAAAIATGACVPHPWSVTKLSHTHYYAAQLGRLRSCPPPAAAAPIVAAGAADVFIAFLHPNDDRTVVVYRHHERTGDEEEVADIAEALVLQQCVDSSNTHLFPLPSCLTSSPGVLPTADAVAAAIATGAPLSPATPVAEMSRTHYYAAQLGDPLPLTAAPIVAAVKAAAARGGSGDGGT